tara:strand:- start:85 stop:261 length:177 start_codon:yes stop_codon:yes gene_type:complete
MFIDNVKMLDVDAIVEENTCSEEDDLCPYCSTPSVDLESIVYDRSDGSRFIIHKEEIE